MASIAANLTVEGIVGVQRFEFAFSSSSWTPPGCAIASHCPVGSEEVAGWAPRYVLSIAGFVAGLIVLAGAFISFEMVRDRADREAADRMRRYEEVMSGVELEAQRPADAAGSRPMVQAPARGSGEVALSPISPGGAARIKILSPNLDHGALETARAILGAIERGQGKGGDERR